MDRSGSAGVIGGEVEAGDVSVRTQGKRPRRAAQVRLVERLSRSIAPLNWMHGAEVTDFDQAGSVLGVRGDDIAEMCRLGLLQAQSIEDSRIEARELVRFLGQHGKAWMQGRLEAMVAKLAQEAAHAGAKSVIAEIWADFARSGKPWGPRPERKTARRTQRKAVRS